MFKQATLFMASFRAITSAYSFCENTFHDFMKGIYLGAAHGVINKAFPKAEPLTFLGAGLVHAEYLNSNPAMRLGHGLAQGLIEGSTYDSEAKQVKLGFSLNFMTLLSILSSSMKLLLPYEHDTLANVVQHDYRKVKNDLQFGSATITQALRHDFRAVKNELQFATQQIKTELQYHT